MPRTVTRPEFPEVLTVEEFAGVVARALTPEERGFGMWRGRPVASLACVNAVTRLLDPTRL